MAHLVRTLRITPDEHMALKAAASALELDLSRLVHDGVIEAAHRLGFYAGVDVPIRRRPGPWPDNPVRHEESATERFSVSYSATTYEVLLRAADYVKISEARFAIGATLRYIADLKKRYPNNAALQAVSLPAQFESDLKGGRR
jgi:hypothetical protein